MFTQPLALSLAAISFGADGHAQADHLYRQLRALSDCGALSAAAELDLSVTLRFQEQLFLTAEGAGPALRGTGFSPNEGTGEHLFFSQSDEWMAGYTTALALADVDAELKSMPSTEALAEYHRRNCSLLLPASSVEE